MARLAVEDMTEEMREHLQGIGVHTIELFKLLLPGASKDIISVLATSAINDIFNKMDSRFNWNLMIRPRDDLGGE